MTSRLSMPQFIGRDRSSHIPANSTVLLDLFKGGLARADVLF